MQTYGLGVKRPFKKDYILPMENLKLIDELFIEKGRMGVLKDIQNFDSTITENDSHVLGIFQFQKDLKWHELKDFIIEEERVFTFSLVKLLNRPEEKKILNVLYSHFRHDLDKKYTSLSFKQTILSMKENKEAFLQNFSLCSYEEQRKIRLYTFKDNYLSQFLDKEPNWKIKRGEKKPYEAPIEVLNIEEYILKKKKMS